MTVLHFDRALNRHVLFGYDDAGAETWQWDGASWRRLRPRRRFVPTLWSDWAWAGWFT